MSFFSFEWFKKPKTTNNNDPLKIIKISDFLEISLETDFCKNMLAQNQLRFTQDDLASNKIRGMLTKSYFSKEFNSHILELDTVKKTIDGGTRKFSYILLQDEYAKIKILDTGKEYNVIRKI